MPDSSLRDVWPDGLESLDFNIYFDKGELDHESLFAALREAESFRVTERSARGYLREAAESERIHGHVEIRRHSDSEFSVGLQVREGPTRLSEKAITLPDFPVFLARLAQIELSEILVFGSGYLRLSTERWRPTVALPVVLPGVIDHVAGAPEIAGLEFTFGDTNQPLRRASVSVFPSLTTLSVRLMFEIPYSPPDDLLIRACRRVSEHLRTFAVALPKPKEPASESP